MIIELTLLTMYILSEINEENKFVKEFKIINDKKEEEEIVVSLYEIDENQQGYINNVINTLKKIYNYVVTSKDSFFKIGKNLLESCYEDLIYLKNEVTQSFNYMSNTNDSLVIKLNRLVSNVVNVFIVTLITIPISLFKLFIGSLIIIIDPRNIFYVLNDIAYIIFNIFIQTRKLIFNFIKKNVEKLYDLVIYTCDQIIIYTKRFFVSAFNILIRFYNFVGRILENVFTKFYKVFSSVINFMADMLTKVCELIEYVFKKVLIGAMERIYLFIMYVLMGIISIVLLFIYYSNVIMMLIIFTKIIEVFITPIEVLITGDYPRHTNYFFEPIVNSLISLKRSIKKRLRIKKD